MKTIIIILFCSLSIITTAYAQSVAINATGADAHSSAILDVSSGSKGILIPRMTKAQRLAVVAPAKGLMVFQDDTDTSGFYVYAGRWVTINTTDSATVVPVNMSLVGGSAGSATLIPKSGTYFGLTGTLTNKEFLLPDAATCPGRMLFLRNNNSAAMFDIDLYTTPPSLFCPGSGICLSLNSKFTLAPQNSVKTIMCISDGVNWTIGQMN